MSTRRSRAQRCPICEVHKTFCYCNEISKIENLTSVSVFMHYREAFLTTNTAKIGLSTLNNFEIFKSRPNSEETFSIKLDNTPLFLFPCEDSIELNSRLVSSIEGPIQLIVPDGTWRQAKKINRKEKSLMGIKRVHLPIAQSSRYGLRKQSINGGLCTYEAIGRALEIIEGKGIQASMEEHLILMVERMLLARGMYMLWPKARHKEITSRV